jgi:hypothetical protein
MRILDQDSNKALKDIILYFTIEEATELRDDLENLISKHRSNEHAHINDLQYTHEVTIAIYDENDLDGFNERSKELILQDR